MCYLHIIVIMKRCSLKKKKVPVCFLGILFPPSFLEGHVKIFQQELVFRGWKSLLWIMQKIVCYI